MSISVISVSAIASAEGNFYLPYSVSRIVWSWNNLLRLHFAWQD